MDSRATEKCSNGCFPLSVDGGRGGWRAAGHQEGVVNWGTISFPLEMVSWQCEWGTWGPALPPAGCVIRARAQALSGHLYGDCDVLSGLFLLQQWLVGSHTLTGPHQTL